VVEQLASHGYKRAVAVAMFLADQQRLAAFRLV
jgi:hypothetical protein